ncbi:MAG: hypothetical protein ABIL62_13155, partial [Planctomycetota bacterium]
ALSLQVGDIDASRKRVHVRRGKGHKDRLVPLPDLALQGLLLPSVNFTCDLQVMQHVLPKGFRRACPTTG